MTLVTGATGFVGSHVVWALAERDEPLRVLVRPSSGLSGLRNLPIDRAAGDLTDPSSLRAALRGCTQLYHVAADYRLWTRDPSALYRTNVEGTRNILTAASEAGVDRVVYTSTVGCIGLPDDGSPGDESTPVSLSDMVGHYKRSKFLAERAALHLAAKGLPVVVVNPTAPVGEGDLKPTPTGRIIVDFLRGATPAYIDTGLNLVDVCGVARGHLLAAEQGKPGERYILGGQNVTLKEILTELARLSGREPPRWRIPYGAAYGFALAGEAAALLTGREPRASLEAVRIARKKMFVRSDKARRELGYEPGSVSDALDRAVQWFLRNGYC